MALLNDNLRVSIRYRWIAFLCLRVLLLNSINEREYWEKILLYDSSVEHPEEIVEANEKRGVTTVFVSHDCRNTNTYIFWTTCVLYLQGISHCLHGTSV